MPRHAGVIGADIALACSPHPVRRIATASAAIGKCLIGLGRPWLIVGVLMWKRRLGGFRRCERGQKTGQIDQTLVKKMLIS